MRRALLIYISLVFVLIGGAVLLRYLDPFFVRGLRLIAFDHFQQLDPPPYDPDLPIRVVDIDEQSLAKIGQWPWPRTTVRDLLLALNLQGGGRCRVRRLICRTGPHLARGHRPTSPSR